jgi:hypothetical protein
MRKVMPNGNCTGKPLKNLSPDWNLTLTLRST